jgi:Transglutaminase-like superfamily
MLSYVSGGAPVQENFTKSIMVEGHNSIDWRDPDSVASFVTPENEAIVAFARAALSSKAAAAVPANIPRSLFAPMVIFNAISAVGTKYQTDPLIPYGDSPIDRVTMPQDMLSELRGDCDDLATLYASLLYASGIRARLVTTPGHIFVAVDSGLPASSAAMLEIDGEHTVSTWNGKAYIPIEITKLDKGFLVAWKEASSELARYASDPKQVQTIDLEAAWKLYPPFPGGTAKTAKLPPEEKMTALLAIDAKGFEAPIAANITDPKLAIEAGVKAAIRRDVIAAKALFETAFTDKNNKAKATINLGNLDVVNKDYDAAEKHYNDAIKAGNASEDEIAYTNLGVVLYIKGDNKKATDAFKKAKSVEAANIAQKLGLEKIAVEKPVKASKEPKLTAVTSKGTTVSLKASTPTKKVKSDSSAVSLGLRGAAADSIDPAEYVRWAK